MGLIGAAQIQILATTGAAFIKSIADSVNKVGAVPVKIVGETKDFFSGLTQDFKSFSSAIKIEIPDNASPALIASLQKQAAAMSVLSQSFGGAAIQVGTFEQRLSAAIPRMSQALRVGGALSASLNRLGLANGPVGLVASQFLGLTVAAQQLAPTVQGLFTQFPKLGVAASRLGGGMGGLEVASLGVAAGLAAIPIAMRAVSAGFRIGLAGAKLEEQVYGQLNARLQATAGIAGVTAGEVAKLGLSLQQTTKFSDDQVAAAAAVGLAYTNVRNTAAAPIFTRALTDSLDLATAWNQDLPAAAKQLFAALQDPVKGMESLGKAGIQFDADQKNLIKTMVAVGNIAGAQEVILGELEDRYNGAATAAGDDLDGAITRLKNNFNEFLTGAVRPLLPVFKSLVDTFSDLLAPSDAAGDSLKKFSNAGVEFGKKMAIPIASVGLLVTALRQAAISVQILQAVTSGQFGEAVRLGRELTRVGQEGIDNFNKALEESGKVSKESAKGVAEAVDLEKEALENLEDQVLATDKAKNDAARSQLDLTQSREDAVFAIEDLAEAEEEYHNILHGFPAESDEAIEAQQKLTDARIDSADAALDVKKADLDLIKSRNELTEATLKADQVLNGYGETSEEGIESLEDLQEATEDVTNANFDLAESILKVQRTQLDLERELFIATRTAEVYGASSRAAALANQTLAESQQELKSNANDVVNDTDELSDANRELAEQTEKTTNTINGFPAESEEARAALEDLAEKQLAVASAELAVDKAHLAVEKSSIALTKAIKEQRDILEGYPADSDKAKVASRKLAEAQQKVADTAQDVTDNQIELREALEKQTEEIDKQVLALQERNRLLAEQPVTLVEVSPGQLRIIENAAAAEEGGSFRAGQFAVVGEKGPELVRFGSAATVFPASSTPQLAKLVGSDASGQPLLVQLNVDGRPFARTLVPHIRAVEREKR